MWSRLQLCELRYPVGLNLQSKVVWHRMLRLQVEDCQEVEVGRGTGEEKRERRKRKEEGEREGEEGEEEEEGEGEEEKECQVVEACRCQPNCVEEVEVVVQRTWVW